MELQTISRISKQFNVSTRTLRYYEEIGLIKPLEIAGLTYRLYDESTVLRLKQIIVLRKLRIPLKQIAGILDSGSADAAIEAFQQNLAEIEDEINALSTIKSVIQAFISRLNLETRELQLLDDESLLEIVDSLTVSKINFKEEKVTMSELNKASENLNKFEDKDIRIVYLPPMTVAAAVGTGEGSEGKALGMITKFTQESGLLKIKPDARSFGFDFSQGAAGIGGSSAVYEVWVSVPDDMQIPEPLVKRNFSGGLYAAHVLRNWDFTDWRRLHEWVNASDKYANDWDTPRGDNNKVTGQGFEETLNFYNYIQKGGKMENLQLDLLLPVREK
jgi:DNA-binding transcriptional MerR regulator